MRSCLLSCSGMLSAVICVWWCAKTLHFASYCISNFLSLVIVRYYACLCGHEELVRYLLANGEQKCPDMAAVSFSGSLGLYVLLAVPCENFCYNQPSDQRSQATEGALHTPSWSLLQAWKFLICLKSWKWTEREVVCDGSRQHDFLKSQLVFCGGAMVLEICGSKSCIS